MVRVRCVRTPHCSTRAQLIHIHNYETFLLFHLIGLFVASQALESVLMCCCGTRLRSRAPNRQLRITMRQRTKTKRQSGSNVTYLEN